MATSQSAQTALSFFQGKGWTPAQAAGIVGNLQAESGLNPQAFNGAGGGNGAAGIAQWRGDRQANFQARYGVPLSQSTYEQQLDFVNYELTQGTEAAAGAKLKATTTAADAATVVSKYYERGEGTDLQKRINNANALTGGGPGAPNTQTPSDVAGEEYQVTAKRPGILYPIPNRLHQYPSYIYGISLHMLSDAEYNDMVNTQTYTPKRVLIASAGRYSPDNFPRSEFFDRDFYFDDLNITTVIAPNKTTRNTNAVDVTFTVIEPYGFTLVERIIKTAKSINSQNYLDQPYMLQVDFFTIDDAGQIVGSVEELRKRIPIKIIKFDVRVSGKGAEYKIQATAFGHSAFDTNTVTTPANFEVVAGSVAEFFQSIEGTPADTVPFVGNQVPGERAITEQYNQGPNFSGTASNTVYTRVKSYGTAINDWNEKLKINGKVGENDVYRFEFDDAIGKSLFTHPDIVTPKRTRMQDSRTPNDFVNIKRQGAGEEQAVYDPTKVIFQINYGTTIEKLLEYVIRNSDYIQNQLIVPEDPDYDQKRKQMADQPLNWFKIIPTVRLRAFDNIRKVWAREITYTVQPYKIFNVRLDIAPQGVQLYPTKNYNYIYTGKNDDVFDFDINFNALYFNAITAYRNSLAELNPTADSNSVAQQTQNFPNYGGGAASMEPNAIMPSILHPVVQNSKAQATGGASDTKQVASVDLADSLMTDSMADMVGLKLKILGDPDFIKQDDIFYKPTPQASIIATPTKPTDDERLLPNNGSLVMDNGVVYAQVLFRTPIDIDESKGLMEFDPDYKTSLFSGLYQVIQVFSNFSRGQFTQELEMSRLPRQAAFDYTELQNTDGTERTQRQESNPNSIPGQLGITQTPPIIPSLLQSGGPQQSTADASDTAVNQTPGQDQPAAQEANTIPPLLTQNAQDLRIINETAPQETITAQTDPQAIVPDFTPISSRGNRVPGDIAVQ